MKLRILPLAFLSGLVAGPAVHAANDDQKGHGAGGVRTEQASEQGLEKGKAWAGSKEKKEQEQHREKAELKEQVLEKEKKGQEQHQHRERTELKEKIFKKEKKSK